VFWRQAAGFVDERAALADGAAHPYRGRNAIPEMREK
jgi:hypothetical protein